MLQHVILHLVWLPHQLANRTGNPLLKIFFINFKIENLKMAHHMSALVTSKRALGNEHFSAHGAQI
jgi:hypothetical protein